jgi:RNA polymerase sigma-70 factor (ECF subfamily)
LAESIAVAGDQESHLDLVDFRKALARLPAQQREVLTMIGAAGLSYEEAADICGVAAGTIKSRLSRARSRLLELLSPDDGGNSSAAIATKGETHAANAAERRDG